MPVTTGSKRASEVGMEGEKLISEVLFDWCTLAQLESYPSVVVALVVGNSLQIREKRGQQPYGHVPT